MAHAHAHHDHDHHDHKPGHGHHHHVPADMGRAFAIGVILNTAFVAAEAAAGLWIGSLSLLADAGHNLSDVLSLLLAVGAIVSEAVHRLRAPAPVDSEVVMLVAGLGVVINGITAALFMRGQHDDLNVRGAFLHMAADAAVSLAVVVGAFAMAETGIFWIDPALGLVIAAVIVFGTWGLLRDSADLALDAAPRGIDVEEVRNWLSALPGVEGVHDLHIWAMSTTETALTAHLTRPDNADGDRFLHEVGEGLAERFRIGHATLQVETDHAHGCRLASAEVV